MKLQILLLLTFALLFYGSTTAQTPQAAGFTYTAAVAWSHDGSKLAAAGITLPGIKGYLRIFDAENGDVLYALDPQPGGFTSVDWSPDDRFIAAGSYDQSIWVTEVDTQTVVGGLFGHRATVTAADWNPDGTQLVSSGSWDGLASLWDMAAREKIRDVHSNGAFLTDAAFSPDGQRIALGGEFGLGVLATDGDNPQRVKRFSIRDVNVAALAWSPDGNRIAIGTQTFQSALHPEQKPNATLYLVESGRGLEIHHWLSGGETVTGIAWSADRSLLATVSADHLVKVWDADSGRLLEQYDDPFPDGARHASDLEFSPHGGRLAYGGIVPDDPQPQLQTDSETYGEGAVRIVVPAPSADRLYGILAACDFEAGMAQTLTTALDSGNPGALADAIHAAPDEAIAPACRTDLLAVAGALSAEHP